MTTTTRINPTTGIRIGKRTLYELAAEHQETRQRVLLAYCSQRSQRGLYNALVERRESLIALMGESSVTTEFSFSKKAADGAMIGKWKTRFTGRTQRDCQGSELPFIVDLVKEDTNERVATS